MKNRKKQPPAKLDMPFEEALARFIGTDPSELFSEVAGKILKDRENAEQRIKKVRKEIEDGVRPRGRRFRL